MKIITLPASYLVHGIKHGWGNGYVLIPPGHPYHGVGYDDIPVEVHGGLTFSDIITQDLVDSEWADGKLDNADVGYWAVGFDTAHYGDNLRKWTKEAVLAETQRLRDQLIDLGE